MTCMVLKTDVQCDEHRVSAVTLVAGELIQSPPSLPDPLRRLDSTIKIILYHNGQLVSWKKSRSR